MKKLVLAAFAALGLMSGAAMAEGHMQEMGAGFGFVLGGTVDVQNIGVAVGDETYVGSTSVKLLEGGFTGVTDGDDASFGAMLNLYGATEGISIATSSDDTGAGSMAGTSESGMVLLTGGGSGFFWTGGDIGSDPSGCNNGNGNGGEGCSPSDNGNDDE